MTEERATGKDLFEIATAPEQLLQGFGRVKRNGGIAGGDGQTIEHFEAGLKRRLDGLSNALREGAYFPGGYRQFRKRKKSGGYRLLRVPSVRDRVVMSAVAQVLTPLAEAEFEERSFGYRPGRSVAQAAEAVRSLRASGYEHVIEGDIDDFFDNVPHDAVLDAFGRFFGKSELLHLVALWLNHAEPDGRGLAQGSPLSPLLANLFLDALDEAAERHPVKCIRYADDFVLLAKSPAEGAAALGAVSDFLSVHGLVLHPDKTRLVPLDDTFVFLGASFTVDDRVADMSDLEEIDPDDRPVPGAAEAGGAGAGRSGRPKKAASRARPVKPVFAPASDADTGSPEESAKERPQPPIPHRFSPRLRSLYILRKSSLTARSNNFVVEFDGGEARFAASEFDRVELGTGGRMDSAALALAVENRLPVVLITGHGLERGRISFGAGDSHRRHLAQAEIRFDASLEQAAVNCFVAGRIHNARAYLRRLNFRRKDPLIAAAAEQIGRTLRKLSPAHSVDRLRGHEGEAAMLYWPAFARCLIDPSMTRTPFRRTRKPANDPLNLVLSVTAGLLLRDMSIFVRRAGLHPGFGLLHRANEDYAVAADLCESLRGPIPEALTIALFNNKTLMADDFSHAIGERDSVGLAAGTMRKVIQAYEAWMERTVRDQVRDENTNWRGICQMNVQRFAEWVSKPGALDFREAGFIYRMDY